MSEDSDMPEDDTPVAYGELNASIVEFLGLKGMGCLEVDLHLRVDQVPTVRIVRHVTDADGKVTIVDGKALTEEKRFEVTEIRAASVAK